MSAQETAVQMLAQGPGGEGTDFGKSSPVGLLLLVLFGVAVALLVKSMTKHLKALPVKFDEQRAEAAAPARAKRTGETVSEAGAAATSAGTASAGTASTGTASTGTASTGTASTGTTSAGAASTGTASTGTTSAGAASTEGADTPREGTSGSSATAQDGS